MRRLRNYQNLVILRYLVHKYKIVKAQKLKYRLMDNISLYIKLDNSPNNVDLSFLKLLDIVENISGQKALLSTQYFKYVGSKKLNFVSGKLNLNKKNIDKFLNYLILVSYPLFMKQYGRLTYKKSNSFFQFTLFNMNIFFNLNKTVENKNIQIRLYSKYNYEMFSDILLLLNLEIEKKRNK